MNRDVKSHWLLCHGCLLHYPPNQLELMDNFGPEKLCETCATLPRRFIEKEDRSLTEQLLLTINAKLDFLHKR